MTPLALEINGFSFNGYSTGGPLTGVKMVLSVDYYELFVLKVRQASDPDLSHGSGVYLTAEQMKSLGQYLLDAAAEVAP